MTIKQKRARASRAAKTRAIVKAVKGLLKKTNPSAKITGAKVVKLRDGVLKITPVRSNPRVGFATQAVAERFARHIEKHQKAKVVKRGGRWVTVWTKSGHMRRK